ncbi:MAG TPA: 3-phosphoshikimate 1-carboxyvinyltransferase, partial [Aequorivita sp.]|nr:3-phosphoshikimate 1-carboxyvinyltransferase [Aequorivita sp.]
MKANLKRGELPSENIKINICGSKSESNRLLILQAQFPNISIENLSDSDDTAVLQKGLKISKGTVDVHHAGTAMRFLTAYFAATEGTEVLLTGSQRMQQRPIGILVDALKSLGADIEYAQNEGFPPLRIIGKKLLKNEVRIKADVSSQYISALMLIAPALPKGLKISLQGKTTSVPYIEMTLQLLRNIGISGDFEKNVISISAKETIHDNLMIVESDWSSASYFYSLVALSDDLQITL